MDEDNSDKISGIKKQSSLLAAFANTLTTGSQMKIVITTVLSVFAGVASFYGKFDKDFESIRNYFDENLNLSGFLDKLFLFWLLSLILAIASLGISCFIRKREILVQNRVYENEKQISSRLIGQVGREFPYDLLGWIVIIIGGAIANILVYKIERNNEAFLFAMIVAAGPFVYAWIRRNKLGNF